MTKKLVIYTRYSFDLQNSKSCTDRGYDVREGPARKGIDATNAIIINDEAQSCTKNYRTAFAYEP